MNILYILVTALLPVVILLWLIYRRDKYCPEPSSQLFKAFWYGLLSVFLSLTISLPLDFFGVYSSEFSSLSGAFRYAFFGAAIPEEIAKFVMLWLLVRHSKYFDEAIDGIVYAVFISLGFAAFENVLYLFNNMDQWVAVGIVRALFSVPAHYAFGVLMGYYYSQYRFSVRPSSKVALCVLLVPIVFHGLFDFILMSFSSLPPFVLLFSLILFIVFCIKMHRFAQKRITEQIERDELWNKLADMEK